MRDSDALLILTAGGGLGASPGTTLAHTVATRGAIPMLVLSVEAPDVAERAGRWLDGIMTGHTADAPLRLGVGGPRESEAPGIYATAHALLERVLRGR